MNFIEACREMQQGKYVRRLAWKNPNAKFIPWDNKPFFYMHEYDRPISYDDYLADDWVIVE